MVKLEVPPPIFKMDSIAHTPIQNMRRNISCDDFELKKKQFDSGNSADPLFMDFEIPQGHQPRATIAMEPASLMLMQQSRSSQNLLIPPTSSSGGNLTPLKQEDSKVGTPTQSVASMSQMSFKTNSEAILDEEFT